MATNKTTNASPVFKMGQLWSTIDGNVTAEEDETEEEEDVTKDNETMKLRREDMSLFGICPAWDQFYLVVCEYCKQVIKPQALQRHIELRHSYHKHNSNQNNTLKPRTDSTNTTTSMPSIRKSLSTTTINTSIIENGSDINTNEDIDEKLVNQLLESNVKPVLSAIDLKPFVDLSVDNICVNNNEMIDKNIVNIKTNSKLINLLSPNISTTIDPLIPEPTGPGPGFATVVSADSDSVTISVPDIDLNNKLLENTNETIEAIVVKPPPKKKSYKKSTNPRKLLPCKDRLYDPNKHCGVCVADSEKPCTRSLTCKTHSLTLRRAVQGRVKIFDELLTEHREAKEAALRAQGIEVKPTKKSIQRQQQMLRQSQQKSEQNQSISDNKTNLQPMTRLVFNDSNPNPIPNSNTNSLLTFSSPLCSSVDNSRTRKPQQSQHRLNQIEVDANGAVHMWCHPRPAAVCNFNIRTCGRWRVLSRSHDLTSAALQATFNSPQFVSKLTNNQKCSSTQSTNALKSPLRNANQLISANKKLCTSLESDPFESSSDPVVDPYSFADGITSNSSYTYFKPKTTTTVAKSSSNTTKKKKKSDNCVNNSSLLTNGQMFDTLDTNKSLGNNKKKSFVKKTANNSHSTCISATIPLTTCAVNNSNNLINSTFNTNCEQLINPSPIFNEVPVPHRNLNDILTNSMDTSKSDNRSDNGSILLNGSLFSCKRGTFSAPSKHPNIDIKDTNIRTIFAANSSNNKFTINNMTPTLTSITSTQLSITPSLRPIIQKQTLPSSSVNMNTSLSQSQNLSQISQNTTNHTIFIKSAKQSLQNQLKTSLSSNLLSSADDFTT